MNVCFKLDLLDLLAHRLLDLCAQSTRRHAHLLQYLPLTVRLRLEHNPPAISLRLSPGNVQIAYSSPGIKSSDRRKRQNARARSTVSKAPMPEPPRLYVSFGHLSEAIPTHGSITVFEGGSKALE